MADGEKHIQVFHTLVTSGNSVELMCDVNAPSNVIWMRNGVEVNDIESEDLKACYHNFYFYKVQIYTIILAF